jgi:hypothetical protein
MWKGWGWRRGTTTIKAKGTLELRVGLVRPTGVPRRHAPRSAEGQSGHLTVQLPVIGPKMGPKAGFVGL